MVSRPYKCPLCHAAFRNESGMKWHIAHRHEIPTAFDTLSKNYEAKIISFQDDNVQLKEKLGEVGAELKETKSKLLAETTARLEAAAMIQQLTRERDKAIYAMVARDRILEEKLGIRLKNPFEIDKTS